MMNLNAALESTDIGATLLTDAERDIRAEAAGVVAHADAVRLLAEVRVAIEAEQTTLAEQETTLAKAKAEAGRLWERLQKVNAAILHASGADRVELQRQSEKLALARRQTDTNSPALSTRRRLARLEALAAALAAVQEPELNALAVLRDALK